MTNRWLHIIGIVVMLSVDAGMLYSQVSEETEEPSRKNVIRYNLSGAMLFGIDHYIVFGYERVLSPHRSMSLNIGRASLPKLLTVSTANIDFKKDSKRSGFNASLDYRFYLAKENKFKAPRGVYVGPYYSYNQFENEVQWTYNKNGTQSDLLTNSALKIHTVGIELGYQFILWKRLSLDLVLVGPGIGFYNYEVNIDGNLTEETKEELFDALEQLLDQKVPGMNYVFTDEHIDGNGVMRTNTLGYRYLIQIGYNF